MKDTPSSSNQADGPVWNGREEPNQEIEFVGVETEDSKLSLQLLLDQDMPLPPSPRFSPTPDHSENATVHAKPKESTKSRTSKRLLTKIRKRRSAKRAKFEISINEVQDESSATSDDSSAEYDDGGASSGAITLAIKDMSDRLSEVLSDVTAKLAALDHRVAAVELEVKQGFVRVERQMKIQPAASLSEVPGCSFKVTDKVTKMHNKLPLSSVNDVEKMEKFLSEAANTDAMTEYLECSHGRWTDPEKLFKKIMNCVFNRREIFKHYTWHGKQPNPRGDVPKKALKNTLMCTQIAAYLKPMCQKDSDSDFHQKFNKWGCTWITTARDVTRRRVDGMRSKKLRTKGRPN